MTITRAVCLVGSAKPAGASTSEALGRYLCGQLEERGVATTLMFVGRSPRSHAEETLAVALVDADLFVLATPLYVDSLPYLVTRTMEHLARSSSSRQSSAAFAAVINCGFPEAEQCRTALDILRAFARRARLDWAGGLALGEGGAIDGQSLEALGGLTRHVRTALDRAAGELAEGRPVPAAAVEQFARRLMPGPCLYPHGQPWMAAAGRPESRALGARREAIRARCENVSRCRKSGSVSRDHRQSQSLAEAAWHGFGKKILIA